MCVGPEIMALGTLASAAGTGLQTRQQNKNLKRQQEAKNAAYAQNQAGQQEFINEAAGGFTKSVQGQGSEDFGNRQQEEKQRFTQAFGERQTTPDYNAGLVSNAPKNVVLARQGASEQAGAETARDVENLGSLTGYDRSLFGQGLTNNEFLRNFGNIQSKAAGQANLLPLQMRAAATNATKAPSLFPTLLKGAGQVASIYGAGGGSLTDQVVPGSMPAGVYGPGQAVTKPGLFTKLGFGTLGSA